MLDERNENLVHGHQFDPNGHHGVIDFMKNHMSEEQIKQLAHTAEHSEHGAHFTAHVDGMDVEYRLHNGKIHKVGQ
jgi:hypothetical protein